MRHKKRLTAAVIAAGMLWQAVGAVPAEILAATVQEGSDHHWGEEFTYDFDASTGELFVHGEGTWPDADTSGVPWADFRDDVRIVGMDYGITSIGESAFWCCSNLTQIDIPDSVTELDALVFLGCSSLESIVLPEGIKEIPWHAFEGCTSLTQCEIPESVEAIEASAFQECTGLTELRLPTGLTSIGDSAFADCASVRKLVIPSGITELPDSMCSDCSSLIEVSIPEGVTEVGDYVFYGCTSLLYCQLPESLTYIAPGMFGGCSQMTVHAYGDHITELREYAFSECDTMTDIILPHTLTKIGAFAFEECSVLKSVVIPAGVGFLDYGTFSDCDALTSVLILNPDCAFDDTRSDLPVFPPQTHLHGIAGSEIEQYAAEHELIFERYLRGDVNCDGVVDEADAEILRTWEEIQNPSAAACINADINYDNLIDYDDGEMLVYYLEYGYFSDETPPETTTATTAAATTTETTAETTEAPDPYSGMCGDDLYWRFDPASGALTVTGTGGMKSAPWHPFAAQITSVDMPDTLTYIYDDAFQNCTALTSVQIPARVEFLAASAFSGCTNLEQFLVSENNTDYYVKKGVLYEDVMDGLLCYPAAKTGDVEIPESITDILQNAFDSFRGSDVIQVPQTVRMIWDGAFLTGEAVKEIWILNPNVNFDDTPTVFADHLIIRGFKDSTAQAYAEQYGLSYLPLDIRGDADCDGAVTEDDLALLRAYLSGTATLSDTAFHNADVDYTNLLNETDAEWLKCFLENGYFPDEAPETTTAVTTTTETTTTTTTTETTTTTTTTETTTTTTTTETTTTTTTTETTVTTTEPEVLSGQCGDRLDWMLDTDTDTLTVYGEGEMYDYETPEQQPWYHLQQRIRKIEFSDGTLSVGAHAFEGCSAVTEIGLPNTMRSIGNAFYQCTDLRMAVLWNQVESIGACAFGKCTGMDKLAILNPACAIDDSKFTISNTAVIFGCLDSTAEKFAKKYTRDFTRVFRGDGSMDDKVSVLDAVYAMLKYQNDTPDGHFLIHDEPENEMLAENLLDVDINGQVTMDDAMYIARYYLMALAGYTPDWNQILQGE